jgi:hypothetical protein
MTVVCEEAEALQEGKWGLDDESKVNASTLMM